MGELRAELTAFIGLFNIEEADHEVGDNNYNELIGMVEETTVE